MSDKTIREICPYDLCVGCGVCAAGCPKNCISMQEDAEGFVRPDIDSSYCINCGLCSRMCPQNHKFEKHSAVLYMAWNKNRDILMASSSGGMFTAVAEWVLKQNGAVVGVAFNPVTKDVYHDIVFSSEDLDKLRLSKYYQSETKHIYSMVKYLLESGQMVLFTGTACQVAAMKSYLGDMANSELLLTMDILCHGVANKKTVSAYIKDREKQYNKKIINFRFRIKEGIEGWQLGSGTRMKLFFEDGTSEAQDKFLDTYFIGFNSNIFLRESCYQCKYCGQARIADFTVGDFWGVNAEKVGKQQMYEGVSVVLINTEKADMILGKLKDDLYIEKINPIEAVPYNRALTEPNRRPAARSHFFALMNKYGFDRAVKKLNRKYYIKKHIKAVMSLLLPRKMLVYIIEKRKRRNC